MKEILEVFDLTGADLIVFTIALASHFAWFMYRQEDKAEKKKEIFKGKTYLSRNIWEWIFRVLGSLCILLIQGWVISLLNTVEDLPQVLAIVASSPSGIGRSALSGFGGSWLVGIVLKKLNKNA